MRDRLLLAAVVGAIALLPLLLSDYVVFRFTIALIWSIALLGMVLLCGIGGQFSLAQAAFYGLGGYVAAIIGNRLPISLYWALPAAMLGGYLAGYLVGRVVAAQGLWNQALITFAIVVVFPQLLRWPLLERLTGGTAGLYLEPVPAPQGIGLSADRWWYCLCLAILCLGALLARNLIDSRFGRALQAARDNELAAVCQGIDIGHYRALGFALGAAFAALAGSLAAIQYSYVAPGTYNLALSVQFLFGIVIGGLGSISGAVIGGLFLQFFPDLTAALGKGLSQLLFAVLLIAGILAMPQGVSGLLGRLRALVGKSARW
jgi:branched-chain amino acid transport system permease protein